MAGYNNYLPNYPYYQPTFAQPQTQGNPINWVQGIEGAKSWPVAQGTSVLLLDSESSVFYIKSTDASGMPLPLRIFEYKEKTQQQQSVPAPEYVTREELEERLAQLTETPVKAKKEK